MSVQLKKMWINKTLSNLDWRVELRFDWSNDRHHAIAVMPPFGQEQWAQALMGAGHLIMQEALHFKKNAEQARLLEQAIEEQKGGA